MKQISKIEQIHLLKQNGFYGVIGDNYFITESGELYYGNRRLSGTVNEKGYIRVGMQSDKFMIHRIVASAFIHNDDIERKTEVNHIDGNKMNNCVSNLEWVSTKENIDHGIKIGLLKRSEAARKDIKVYETKSVFRSAFKKKVEKEGFNFSDFEEVFAEWYIVPGNNTRIRKFFYRLREDK